MPPWLSRLFGAKAGPPAAPASDPVADIVTRRRDPNLRDLFNELRGAAYTCASLNASVCATFPPRLYVTTKKGQPAPKCETRPVDCKGMAADTRHRFRTARDLHVEEVVRHPLLDLFAAVNEEHNATDLWEITTLSQEVAGSAFWLLETDGQGRPVKIWPLITSGVTILRDRTGLQGYEYRVGGETRRYTPEEVVHFKYPDPRDPYGMGLSPLRACYDHMALDSAYTELKRAKFDNHALPSVIISPDEVLSEPEARRLEAVWNARFRKGGSGRVLVSESALKVHVLSQSLGDLQTLAEIGASKEVVVNAFGVPAPYIFRETNLANLQAAQTLHAHLAIRPRLLRRDDKLNERLVPLFDPSGRLFVASEDPRPEDREMRLKEQVQHVQAGIRTVDEVRAELGLSPMAKCTAQTG